MEPALPEPPLTAPPRPDEAWVWAIRLSDPPAPVGGLAAVLSADERARAARFRFQDDRMRSLVGRGMLRLILGGCIGAPPASLRFIDLGHGKPGLARAGAQPATAAALDFNVSHSGDWVMIGLVTRARIGVDVERIRPLSDLDALTERFFAAREARTVRGLPPVQRVGAFFDCWTRKEAYIKAIGTGMQTALDRFEVEMRPGCEPRLLSIDGSAAEAARWHLWSAAPDAEHRAAVAVEGAPAVRARLWTGSGGPMPWHG